MELEPITSRASSQDRTAIGQAAPVRDARIEPGVTILPITAETVGFELLSLIRSS
jgi:hypothetical protein